MKRFLLFILVCLTAHTVFSQPGSLDKSFGENGFSATTDIGYHNAIVQQPDGKLVTASSYSKGGVIRFLPDGTLDSTFGTAGFISFFSGRDLVLLPDNKILVLGSARDETDTVREAVVRLLPNGKADSSFGENGFVFTPIYKDRSSSYDHLRVEKDGTVVISGSGITYPQSLIPEYSYISFISPDGVFNTNYGDNGRLLNYTNVDDKALALQKDGKILVGGYNFPEWDFAITRYNMDGSIDESFGDGGTVLTDVLGQDNLTSIAVQDDQKIVVSGYPSGGIRPMMAVRYQTDGTLDPSFGEGGKVFVSFGNLSASPLAVLLQPDGKIILAGYASTFEARPKSSIGLCRLNTNGILDSSFGIDGLSITPYLNYDAGAYCAVFQKDGKIVTGGSYYNTRKGYDSYLLARFNGDGEKKSIIAKIKRRLNNHGIGWKGLDNTAVNYYSVQYSPNGSGFSESKRISGAGTFMAKDYDCAVDKAGYYRVVAVDRNGYKTFSNKVLVSEGDITASAGIYPNPAKDYVTVYGLPGNAKSNISITDGTGNVKIRGISSGGSQYQSSVSNLPPGTYYLNISSRGSTQSLPFMKE